MSTWEILAAQRNDCISLLCYRYYCNPEEAEDAVSIAIVELGSNNTINIMHNPLGYLFQVARHRLYDERRNKKSRNNIERLFQSSISPSYFSFYYDIDAIHDLRYYLSHLLPIQRFRLLSMLNDGVENTASYMQCTPGAVKAGVHKTRQRLLRLQAQENNVA